VLTRRSFLSTSALSLSALAVRRSFASAAVGRPSLVVHPETVLAQVPNDFTGLSYESSQLTHTEFFCGSNKALVRFFRTLGSSGVLRIGGNTSEFTRWSAVDPANESVDGAAEGPDPGQGLAHRVPPPSFTITPRSIRNLNAFLEATNWKLIYGLNLARGTSESAAEEAACVAGVCGPRLLALQFGNEPDLFRHDGSPARKWEYAEFIDRWLAFQKAVRQKLPSAALAGPDISFQPEWIANFARETKGDICLLTGHYYPEGPPTDASMTIDRLLKDKSTFDQSLLKAIEFSKQADLPFRMSEGNTCYNAGKRGVSDTFASALWAGDFMAQIAALGGTGVNLHGGGDGFYTPIAGSQKSGFSARPDFYGMLFARPLNGATMLSTELNAQGINLTAYALRREGRLTVLAFNKSDRAAEIDVSVSGGAMGSHASILRLTAPAIDATSGVQLGGGTVGSDGILGPQANNSVRVHGSRLSLSVPAYSAVSAAFS
jgi:hypothetical protein